MANPYFGEPWDAPVTDGAERVATPFGMPCGWCRVPIALGDQGTLIGSFEGPAPWHRECLMRMVVGSPEHLDGNCSCHGGDVGAEQTPEQMRAEALEVWRRVMTGRLTDR